MGKTKLCQTVALLLIYLESNLYRVGVADFWERQVENWD